MPQSEGGPNTVGRYTLLRKLAEGGMAQVFLAEQHSEAGVRKLVALKRMLPHLCQQPQFVAMFLDEARLAARLTHQNIAQIVDFGVSEGQYFLAMEYLSGESLGSVLRHATERGVAVPFGVAVTIISQLCDGLHYAHTFSEQGAPLGVVHRDVTPSNVLLTFQGGVKIIDFGIARARGRLQEATESGVFKGKLAYASPEQLAGLELDARSDVFSVGVLLHELLTGERLFRRDTDLATLNAVMQGPTPPVRTRRPDLPPEIDAVLARALAKNREARYPTAQALRRDLDPLMPTRPVRLDDWLESLFGPEVVSRSPVVATDPTPDVLVATQPATATVPKPAAAFRRLTAAAVVLVVVGGTAFAIRHLSGPRDVVVSAPPPLPLAPPPAATEVTHPEVSSEPAATQVPVVQEPAPALEAPPAPVEEVAPAVRQPQPPLPAPIRRPKRSPVPTPKAPSKDGENPLTL